MNVNDRNEERARRLRDWYGDGANGVSPTVDQWRRVLERPEDRPLTLVNFFKLRERAVYAHDLPNVETNCSGQEAFDRYAAVSMPTLEKVGGRFLLVAPFEGVVVGDDEDWDLVAVGAYPNKETLLALFEDADYRACFAHRAAACARQKVFLCDG